LAERAGLSVRGLSDLERGLRRLPHPATLRRLSDALDLDAAQRADLLAAAQLAPDQTRPTPPLETHYARSGDVNIAYQVVGEGPIDLVFVMGWVSHLDYYWQEPRFARFLRRLASFARVILFDKRGTGLSDRTVGLPSLEVRMDDVRAVLDAVGSERAVLLGISEGGALCVLFAATYPWRTAGLGLVGSFPRRLWAPDFPWGARPEDRERRAADMARSWGSPEWAIRDLEWRAPGLAHDPQFSQWWATYLRMSASPGAALAMMQMNNDIDVRPVLPTIHVPTLVIHRAGDRQVMVETGRHMAALIPGARYLELPGNDHLPFVGDQDAILDALEEFVVGRKYEPESDRVLATVLALDVAHASARSATHAGLVRDQLERFRGRAAGTSAGGDMMATFDGPARGIRCALAIVDQSRPLGLTVRGALHTGECDLVDGGLGGMPFHIASTAIEHARPGEVLVSRTVRDLVAGSGIQFDEHEQRLAPNGQDVWQLFRVARLRPRVTTMLHLG